MLLNIRFPNLGISLPEFGTGFTLFGLEIKYYGIFIAIAFMLGLLVACREAKRTGQNSDDYMDFLLWMIIPAILGARLYYVFFSFDYYKEHPAEILAIRNGGLAIYGGVIAAFIVLLIFSRKKHLSMRLMLDTIAMSLPLGQAIGRWGNFTNREAFGCYTDSLFAMQIAVDEASYTTPELLEKLIVVDGISYIQVHPTFLYESLWNLAIVLIILLYRKRKKFDGELFAIYVCGYGIGRTWIEGLRTDQLQIGNSGIAVSQVLSAVLALAALGTVICKRVKRKKTNEEKTEKMQV
ncbi:MAG: prolipoprotein diacylglyceryl transferase [Lachnospiraceae bacterium]